MFLVFIGYYPCTFTLELAKRVHISYYCVHLSYFKYNIENKFYSEFIDWHTTIEWHTYPNGYSALRARLQRQIIIRPRDSLGDDGKVLEEERILEK